MIFFLFFKVIIEFIYMNYIMSDYSYMGLTPETSVEKLPISLLLLIFVIWISPKNSKKPSTYTYIILEIFIFLSVTSYYCLNNQSSTYTTFLTVSFIVMALIKEHNF